MITEDYVSFEIAKLLKEKGFDCACEVWYSEYTSQFGGEKYTSIEFDNHNRFKDTYKFICYAPTIQMVMKWLREVHKIHISVDIGFDVDNHQYYFFIPSVCRFSDKSGEYETPFGEKEFNTYEEATEDVIVYCLENLI